MQEVTWRGENGAAIVSPVNSASAGGQRFGHKKNKAVDAVYRQRPCQPRILKSAHAIRWTTGCPRISRAYVNQFTLGGQNWRNHAGAAGGPLWAGASRSRTIHAGYVRSRQNPEQLRRNKNLELRF